MDVKRVEPSFGMAMYKTRLAKNYITKLTPDDINAIDALQARSRSCPYNIMVSVVGQGNKLRLRADVGQKSFVQNFFFGPVRTIRRAVRYAEKLQQQSGGVVEEKPGIIILNKKLKEPKKIYKI